MARSTPETPSHKTGKRAASQRRGTGSDSPAMSSAHAEGDGQRQLVDEMKARIARKAFELFEHRGSERGHDLEDWFEAERIVMEEKREQEPGK